MVDAARRGIRPIRHYGVDVRRSTEPRRSPRREDPPLIAVGWRAAVHSADAAV